MSAAALFALSAARRQEREDDLWPISCDRNSAGNEEG